AFPDFAAHRASFALRNRYAEDQLATAVASGTAQYVILGAGLDSFAYRCPDALRGLQIFEVDHPSSQAWKRARVAELGMDVRLLDELRQRTNELGRSVEELRALGEVSQAVNSTLELETVLSTIVANAVQLSGTEAGAICVFDELQRALRLRATYGMDRDL